jgi:alkylation response protein AidB-like acyl-CoA dehydrogenase
MKLALEDEQRMLYDSARSFIEERSPLSRIRELRDSEDALGYTPGVWKEMAELGWQAIPFPEEHGGLGLGMAEVILVTEAMGRGLAPEPYISSVIWGGQLLAAVGSDAQKAEWLPAIAGGEKRITVASHETGARYSLSKTVCRATRSGDGFTLSGDKSQVLDANEADAIIVVTRTSGEEADENGLTLFLVSPDTPGVEIVRQNRLDSRNVARIVFEDAQVPESAIVGVVDEGLVPLTNAVDRATIALCGEMLGAMSRAFDMALEYLRERKQFGVHIGSFQSLQHRAADLFMEIELARTATMAAARTMDEGEGSVASQSVCIAKARCSDVYLKVANEAVQMFAGIGMTDEHDIGFFMKRARVCDMTFGDAAYHRDRWATLNGF